MTGLERHAETIGERAAKRWVSRIATRLRATTTDLVVSDTVDGVTVAGRALARRRMSDPGFLWIRSMLR